MNTETHEHRKRASEAGPVAEGETGPSRARMEPDGSPSAQQKLCPLSLAGNVSRVELWEPELMVATVQESGDQFLFGADDEEEEYSRNYGEDKDQLISQFWDDAVVENAPVVSNDRLTELDETAFQQEVRRLQDMKVLRKAKREDLTGDFTELSATAVQDWRHRGGSWQSLGPGQITPRTACRNQRMEFVPEGSC